MLEQSSSGDDNDDMHLMPLCNDDSMRLRDCRRPVDGRLSHSMALVEELMGD